jgi:hypothetical protein
MIELWRRLGRLLLRWTLVSTLAGALAYGVFLGLAVILPGLGPASLSIRLAIAGGAGGLAAGFLQRGSGKMDWRTPRTWAWATAAGWAVGLPAAAGFSVWIRPLVVDLPDGFRLGFILTGVGLIGAAAAFWQWLLLKKSLEGALWWLLANGIGWLMAWILVLAIGLFLGAGEPLPVVADRLGHGLILGACAGFVIGLEQGIALVGLIAQEAWIEGKK